MIQPCHLKRLQRSYKEPFSSNAVFDDENYIITSTQMMQIIGNKTNTQTHSFLSLKNSRSETEGSIQQKSSVPNQFPAINENNKRIRKLNNWSSLLISAAITKKKSTLHSSNPPILCLWNWFNCNTAIETIPEIKLNFFVVSYPFARYQDKASLKMTYVNGENINGHSPLELHCCFQIWYFGNHFMTC